MPRYYWHTIHKNLMNNELNMYDIVLALRDQESQNIVMDVVLVQWGTT